MRHRPHADGEENRRTDQDPASHARILPWSGPTREWRTSGLGKRSYCPGRCGSPKSHPLNSGEPHRPKK
jgi:hypothetical protein